MNGLLPIDKPAGMVSKDVSRWLQKRCGKLKLGHVGTLDPAASGVLPILLGRATRLQDLLLDMPKAYEFDVRFGIETDTLDQEGKVIRETPWQHIDEASLSRSILRFIGEVEQTPPLYSAVKYKGKPLYEYARSDRGDDVPLEGLKRRVHVSTFEMLRYGDGMGTFRVTCSRGTYVRVLVKDLAESVESCGTLTRLVRTQAAGIQVQDALSLEALEARLPDLASAVIPTETIDVGLPRWRSPLPQFAGRLKGGQQVALELGEYDAGFGGGEAMMPGGWAKPLLLLDESGRAFGIGNAKRQESGRVVISMKRGL